MFLMYFSYFAVICFGDNSTGKNVCLSRVRQQLPATVVVLPEMYNVSDPIIMLVILCS